MQINEIYMKGALDLSTFAVVAFDMTGLSVLGNECFHDTIGSQVFLADKCFYGNADVKIDYEDPERNYLQGYFKNLTIYNLLTNTLDFGNWNLCDNVTKHILSMRIPSGAEISYAAQDVTEKEEGTNQSLTILQGYTVKSEVIFVGLEGVVIMNIDPKLNELYGIFHFV